MFGVSSGLALRRVSPVRTNQAWGVIQVGSVKRRPDFPDHNRPVKLAKGRSVIQSERHRSSWTVLDPGARARAQPVGDVLQTERSVLTEAVVVTDWRPQCRSEGARSTLLVPPPNDSLLSDSAPWLRLADSF